MTKPDIFAILITVTKVYKFLEIVMETVIKKIDASRMTSGDFSEAVRLLKEGKLVAFPTETVYGLGGNAYDRTASQRIYAAKGRPSDNPLIVHISCFKELEPLVSEIPETARKLADKFWPGPMTLIFNKSDIIPKETTGGLDTVAIRMPSHPIANRLIKEAGIPIAAPSANASGRPSTTRAEHVIEDLSGRIDMIIDGGSSDIGLESTIVDLTVTPALILRPGYITLEMLKTVIPDIEYDKAVLKRMKDDSIVAKAPGMKYRHYAPKGELTIYEGTPEKTGQAIFSIAKEKLEKGFKVGILTSNELAANYTALGKEYEAGTPDGSCAKNECLLYIRDIGSRENEAEIAAGLFDALRSFDEIGADFIYAEAFSEGGLGQAIMNRLMKAAGYHIINV